MKTLKEELQGCLSEMQATAKKFEGLMNTPGITWPELEVPEQLGTIIGKRGPMNHSFEIGEIVEILKRDFDGDYNCKRVSDKLIQYVSPSDIIIYTPEK